MRKRILKKLTAVMMAATMMFSMAGCGKSNKSSDDADSENTKDMVYASEDLVLEGLEGDVSSVSVVGDKLYVNTYEWNEAEASTEESDGEEKEDSDTTEEVTEEDATTEKETSEDTTEEDTGEAASSDEEETSEVSEEEASGSSIERLYSMNLDCSDVKEITLPEKGDGEWLSSFFPNEAGTFTYLYVSYNNNQPSYSIVKADENGEISSKEDITDILGISNDDDTYLSNTLMDDNENMVFIFENGVKVLDKDNKLVCDLESEDNTWLEGAAKTKDGEIVVASSSEKAQVQLLDIDGKKWGEKYELNISYFSSSDSLMSGMGDYDFYYKDSSGVYGYDMTAKNATKLMDYMASNIDSDNAYSMMPYEDGKFLCNYWDEDGTKLCVYSKVDPSTIKDKKTITVSMLYEDDEVKKAAMEFNQNNDEYQIELKDYSDEEEPVTKMNADIVAGNVSDIICLGSDMPVEQYVSKGLLEDLTPYFEKDEELNEDDIIDSLREAMEIDGKLYYVASSFAVSTLMASGKDVGEEMGWTFKDLKELLETKGDDVRPFYGVSKESMLYSLAGNATNDNVDWTTGECNFDSQDFKDILEICSTGTDDESGYYEDEDSMPTLIQEGKVLFVEGSVSLDEMQLYSKMFNDDMTFIGYPSEDKQGSYFTMSNSIGIYSKSEVKDAAWEFIRTFMTKEYQGKKISNGNLYGNIPSRKDALDLQIQIAMATEKFTDEYGKEHEPVDSSWGWDDLEVKIGPSSQADVDIYMELINNTTKIGGYNQSILDIIIEESKAYFSGDKTVDETAEVIQNRVKTYVNENR